MIIFNEEKKYFEHSEEELEIYIENKLKKSNFNETQLKIITELTFNVIDITYDMYRDYLGDAILLLKVLRSGKIPREDDRHPVMGNWLIYADDQPYNLFELRKTAPIIYHLCAGSYIYGI